MTWGDSARRTQANQFLNRFGIDIEYYEREAGGRQILRHGSPHNPQSNETYSGGHLLIQSEFRVKVECSAVWFN